MYKCISCNNIIKNPIEIKDDIEVYRPNIKPVLKPRQFECPCCKSQEGFLFIAEQED